MIDDDESVEIESGAPIYGMNSENLETDRDALCATTGKNKPIP